jgi:hypothetical protein
MAKRIIELDEETGRVRSGRRPKSAKLIPWTPGPKTRTQRIIRALVG